MEGGGGMPWRTDVMEGSCALARGKDINRGAVASGSSLVLPRAAAGTRGKCSTLPHYTGASIARCAIQRHEAGEEERRRDEGAGERAKEVARTAGGKATGAWVIGG